MSAGISKILTWVVFLVLFAGISNSYACGAGDGKCGCLGNTLKVENLKDHKCPGSCMCGISGKSPAGGLTQPAAAHPSIP